MKTCPQCGNGYEDDYFFCLTDGNTLVDESGEQITVVNRFSPRVSDDRLIACSNCGAENRLRSSFCKKCGSPVANMPPATDLSQRGFHSPPNSFVVPTAAPNETVTFQPPPRPLSTPGVAANSNFLSSPWRIGALAAALVFVMFAIIYAVSEGPAKTSKSTNRAANAAKQHADVGKTGRLTTNQKIRSSSNLDSEVLGVHYFDARIEVLDVSTYTASEGVVTMYRVRVLQNGCDYEGRLGCGNDLNGAQGSAAMQGWMSAKNIKLD